MTSWRGKTVVIEAIEKGQLVLNAGYALIAGSVFLVARMLLQESEARAAEENLLDQKDRDNSNFLLKVTRPFFGQYIVPIIRSKPFWDESRQKYRRRIIAAGLRREITPDEFIGYKFFLILFFPMVGGFLKYGDFLDLSGWYILGTGVAGYFYPDFWISSRIKKRQRQIQRSMPFIVDLLALSTEAGLDFVGAIGKVVEKARASPLVEEFEQLLKEIKVGSSRADALREMALRVDMTEINSFVAILISADQMGASIGKILRQQSEQIRTLRFVKAEKAGAAASQALLLPLIFFIMPAVILMIFGPFIISMVNNPITP